MKKRLAMILLAALSLGFLVGDDCEFELEGLPWYHDDGYYYEEIWYEPVYPVYPVYYY